MSLKQAYRRFRAAGYTAEHALRNARILLRWERFERAGLVRVQCDDELENYFDVYGEPDNLRERAAIIADIERYGCVCVYTQYRKTINSENWTTADSIGMCIYLEPECPFDNPYVVDLMDECLRQFTRK